MILQWVMIFIFFGIGLFLFIKSYSKKKYQRKRKNYSTYTPIKAFLLGSALKAINPLQFVFWTFWSTYLIANDWLQPKPMHYNVFCLGLGLATFGGFILYVFLGNYLQSKSFFSKIIFHRIIAMFLSITSVAWAIKLLIKPDGLFI